MSALGQPRMCWLACGHEAISCLPVHSGRKLHCSTCKTPQRITYWGLMDSDGKSHFVGFATKPTRGLPPRATAFFDWLERLFKRG